jgi:hypothetical protein
MEEAMRRLEAGEDPETIEAEMGDVLDGEAPAGEGAPARPARRRGAPQRDDTLYEL